jgi:transposase
MGDINSHDIIKGNKNKTLNSDFTDLKFYQFKQRLKYKASINGKRIVFVNEAYTTQGCSSCGNLWKSIGKAEIYRCRVCKFICGRDLNASKNIMLKGFYAKFSMS